MSITRSAGTAGSSRKAPLANTGKSEADANSNTPSRSTISPAGPDRRAPSRAYSMQLAWHRAATSPSISAAPM
jgi:hypothetical protein